MRRTPAAAGLLVSAALSIGFSGTAHAADLNCSDFATQAEAQTVYNADPTDPNNLDADHDGIPCESRDGGTTTQTEDGTALGTSQVKTQPSGAVAAGDGSSSTDEGSALPYLAGGVALTAAGGAAFAARRSSRAGA
jgi:Excalibur calcium-binding domain